MSRDNQKFYRNYYTKLVLQNLRDKELKKITNTLKDVDFAEAEALAGMYEYRMKDEED